MAGSDIDLDAKRRARAEKNGHVPSVTLKGVRFEMTPEIPFSVVESLGEGGFKISAVREVASKLLGSRAEEFFALEPSVDEMGDFLNDVSEAYAGRNLPNSSGASGSSRSVSRKRKSPSPVPTTA